MRKIWPALFSGAVPALVGVLLLAFPAATRTQSTSAVGSDTGAKNAAQARAVLNAMIQALGGQAWLNQKNREIEGHVAAFFHGTPDLGTTETFEYHQWPDHDRIEVTKHRDVVEFIVGDQGWEVTYRGKKPMDKDTLDDYLRRRDHSIETAVKVWLKEPNTILIYEGQRLAERHLAEQVTLISPQNEAITILMDAQTHLPLRRVFQWRDPVYHDKNTDAEEYDDYHDVDGFPTPFTISRFKNDDQVRQYYVTKVSYNQNLPANFWDPDAAARKIAK
ncbi:MAG TPA: hypothetical protein VMD55_01885 [Terracidiphilus sp.]|nr:hypothetical protein [Terracidiphilus sp.]